MELKIATAVTSTLVALTLSAPAMQASETEPKGGGSGPKKITECRTIHKPGSYVVTRNLTADTNESCLIIEANNVTLDLGGFTLMGAFDFIGDELIESGGVTDNGLEFQHIVVRNGTSTGFLYGIDLAASSTVVVEDIGAIQNAGEGIRVGSGSTVRGNTIQYNDYGITTGSGCAVIDNIIYSNGDQYGIVAGPGNTISGNTASNNGFPYYGATIFADQGSTVTGNTVTENGRGIHVRCPSVVIGNTAVLNKANLVLEGDGCVDVNNVAPNGP